MPMQKSYIHELLVRYLYRELPADEAADFAQLLAEIPALRAELKKLQSSKNLLVKAQFNPSPAVLNNILQYSTKTALEAQL